MNPRLEIPGFPGYSADSTGKVFGVHGQPMTGFLSNGYRMIKVKDANGKRRSICAHRLVVLAFQGSIPEGMWVNHKNGIRDDNRIENLEVTTPSENHRHARDVLGRKYVRGERSGTSRLNEKSVQAIRALKTLGWSNEALAEAFSVSPPAISYVNTGRTWSHVSDK